MKSMQHMFYSTKYMYFSNPFRECALSKNKLRKEISKTMILTFFLMSEEKLSVAKLLLHQAIKDATIGKTIKYFSADHLE